MLSTATVRIAVSQQAAISYITLSEIRRGLSTTNRCSYASSFSRSDFQGQPFTGTYEPGLPTRGPLGEASASGGSRLSPRRLREYVDQYVVGQDIPKKRLCSAIYNHHQRIQELKRQDEDEQEKLAQRHREFLAQRPQRERYDSENEYDEHEDSQRDRLRQSHKLSPEMFPLFSEPQTSQPVMMEKSNVVMLGPTGVGKTLLIKTIAKALEVPFSMSDCTPFTQAGYIGEDAEVCVQRLLAAADYDVTRAEHGIICLDEIDKLAAMKSVNGRDVGGEGVQQALLKIIEGTTLTVTAKSDQRSVQKSNNQSYGSAFTNGNPNQASAQNKPDTYTIRTDNILFICTGAFVGLQKLVLNRINKGSIGFGATVRSASSSDLLTMTKDDASLYFKHTPFFNDPTNSSSSSSEPETKEYNPLDLVTPSDLQKFGLIPELLGRLPVSIALSPLSIHALSRVLTEPVNSLTAQYQALFRTYGVELRFTSLAVREIATSAHAMGTGARGCRTVVEQLLAEAMYEVPGSSVRSVLVTEQAAKRKEKVGYWGRGAKAGFYAAMAAEEDVWEAEQRPVREAEQRPVAAASSSAPTFQSYRAAHLAG